jgi:hypothetical protein
LDGDNEAMQKPSKDHYLPAGFIGGFGIPHPSKDRRRFAKVCTRARRPEAELTRQIKAENIAYGFNLYAVENLTADLPRDWAEQIWKLYESDLPDAAKRLEQPGFSHDDWSAVLAHIQAAWIRNPGFDSDAARFLAETGITNVSNDQIQHARKAAYELLPDGALAKSRFAVIRKSEDARRFIIDNRGFVPPRDEQTGQSGVLFPLTGNVAVLMVYDAAQPGDDYTSGPFAQRVLIATGAQALHIATWNHGGIEFVIGHPDDADWIAELTDEPAASLPAFGPYQGSSEAVFKWATVSGR